MYEENWMTVAIIQTIHLIEKATAWSSLQEMANIPGTTVSTIHIDQNVQQKEFELVKLERRNNWIWMDFSMAFTIFWWVWPKKISIVFLKKFHE